MSMIEYELKGANSNIFDFRYNTMSHGIDGKLSLSLNPHSSNKHDVTLKFLMTTKRGFKEIDIDDLNGYPSKEVEETKSDQVNFKVHNKGYSKLLVLLTIHGFKNYLKNHHNFSDEDINNIIIKGTISDVDDNLFSEEFKIKSGKDRVLFWEKLGFTLSKDNSKIISCKIGNIKFDSSCFFKESIDKEKLIVSNFNDDIEEYKKVKIPGADKSYQNLGDQYADILQKEKQHNRKFRRTFAYIEQVIFFVIIALMWVEYGQSWSEKLFSKPTSEQFIITLSVMILILLCKVLFTSIVAYTIYVPISKLFNKDLSNKHSQIVDKINNSKKTFFTKETNSLYNRLANYIDKPQIHYHKYDTSTTAYIKKSNAIGDFINNWNMLSAAISTTRERNL